MMLPGHAQRAFSAESLACSTRVVGVGGMFSTFHAHYPALRWPLDHVFVSKHFTLVNMQRLDAFGSDHFPILATFCYRPSRQEEHETLEANGDEHKEARETIQQGKKETQAT